MFRNKHMKARLFKYIGVGLVCAMVLSGCGTRPTDVKDAAPTYEEIDDVVEIPEDGIITADQFNAFAGTDRVVDFEGKNGDISYTWSYPGRNIHNAIDSDLSIDFITEDKELADIKAASGNAPYAIGMELKGTGLVTVPTLTITIPEGWDADTAVFCKEKDGSAMRLADAEIETKDDTTTFSMKVTEVGDTYYIVAGLSEEAAAAANEAKKEAKADDAETDDEKTADTTVTQETTTETYEETVPDDAAPTQQPEAPQEEAQATMTCTISISCATILDNWDKLDPGKQEFVPADGLILAPTTVEFSEGDSVFDVLAAVCRAANIHMEHAYTPIYGSEYVEGINQLYEFDCGELSGWMFSVDGWYPNYGCDKYILSDGETIQWVYTCDLGKDVGDNSQW